MTDTRSHTVSLIGNPAERPVLDESAVAEVARLCGAAARTPVWLAEGLACDIPVHAPAPGLADRIATALAGRPVDVNIVGTLGRAKRLLIADMDSTIIPHETLDELAAHAGVKDAVSKITARAMAGELDFKQALRARVRLLEGLPVTAIAETLATVTLNPGAATLVATMKAHGARTALVSGGFVDFAELVADRTGFDGFEANRFETADGRLTGRVIEPVLNRDGKVSAALRFAGEYGVGLGDTLAVGDGANDLAMLMAVGRGVAWHAKPVVAAAASTRINHGDLTALLYLQGYREAAFSQIL